MSLEGKVCVVTGGAGLLGQAFCQMIGEKGGFAIIADVNEEAGRELAKKVPNSEFMFLDISKKKSVRDLIKSLNQKFQKVDVLVNNAYPRNKNYGRSFFSVEYDDFCENLNLNLGGYFLTSQIFLEEFFNQGHGNIVNIASIYGVIPPRFEIYSGTNMTTPVEYAVIKSGLIHLTKYMAKLSAGKNVKVNSISPGGIYDSQPEPFLSKYKEKCLNKGMLNPEDIVGALSFLLQEESQYVNGQNIVVDDGFCL